MAKVNTTRASKCSGQGRTRQPFEESNQVPAGQFAAGRRSREDAFDFPPFLKEQLSALTSH